MLGVEIFFIVLGVALVILVCIGIFAKKYLDGYFTKVPESDTEHLLESGEEIDEFENPPQSSSSLTPEKKAVIIDKYKRPVVTDTKADEKPKASTATLLSTARQLHQFNERQLNKQQKRQSFSSRGSNEYQQFNETTAINKIQENTAEEFASKAVLFLHLKYVEAGSCIVGNVRTISGLNFEVKQKPKDIQFHLKLLPGGKLRMKTAWRPATEEKLLLTFTIGPISVAQSLQCRLCLRLYGRTSSKMYALSQCYGETSVKLSDLIGNEKGLELRKPLLPKGAVSINNTEDSEIRFTSDSEAEH